MGFRDDTVSGQAEKRLRPFMRPDERIIECDIANARVESGGDVRTMGQNIPVVLTNRAIYISSDPVIRTPYAHVTDVQAFARGRILVSTRSGNNFLIDTVGATKGDIYDTVSHHLEKVTLHRERIEVPGGVVTAECRDLAEDGAPGWLYRSSPDVNLASKETQTALAAALEGAAMRLEVPLPGVASRRRGRHER